MYPSAVSPALIVVEILCMSGNTYGTLLQLQQKNHSKVFAPSA